MRSVCLKDLPKVTELVPVTVKSGQLQSLFLTTVIILKPALPRLFSMGPLGHAGRGLDLQCIPEGELESGFMMW